MLALLSAYRVSESGLNHNDGKSAQRQLREGESAMASSRSATFRVLLAPLTIAALVFSGCTVASQSGAQGVTPSAPTAFGTLANGQSTQLFTLRNAHGVEVQ